MTDEPKPYDIHRSPRDYIDGSMTRRELVAALEHMRFTRRDGTKSIELAIARSASRLTRWKGASQ
jgi:hypothetical protein